MSRFTPAHVFPTCARRAALIVMMAMAMTPIGAQEQSGLLETIHHHRTLTTTVTEDGDLNPYAIVVATATVGRIHKDDVLVDNFNNISNLQGTGGTIIDYDPSTRKTTLFAKIPQHLPQCPGGVGLSAAMAMLSSGWVIVGSTPSSDGSTSTRGDGGLIVIDANGVVATVWAGPKICDPWGNIVVVDHGDTAILLVSMAGFGVVGPQVRDPVTGYPVSTHNATVLRITLKIPAGKQPEIVDQTVIGDGFGQRADKDAFMVGPTGLALGSDGTLYVCDSLDSRICAIPEALTRTTSGGTGRTVTKDGLLVRPLALAITPAGHLLTCNAKNGKVVEIDPVAGTQLYAQWIDTNQAQSPPGNGDLFGIAMCPDGKGFYYVQDETSFLMMAR